MISQRCRHQGRGSVFNRCFTSSIDTCAAAWVTLAIPFLLLLCQDLLLILPQIADWYQMVIAICCTDERTTGTQCSSFANTQKGVTLWKPLTIRQRGFPLKRKQERS